MPASLGWVVQALTAATLLLGLCGAGLTFATGRGRRLVRRFLGIEDVRTSVQAVAENVDHLRGDINQVRDEIETVKGASIAQIKAGRDDGRDVDLDVVYEDYYGSTDRSNRYLSDESLDD